MPLVVSPNPYIPLPDGWRERLAAMWPDGARLTWAWRLAGDFHALADLIEGRTVDAARLDDRALVAASREQLVQLIAPATLFSIEQERVA